MLKLKPWTSEYIEKVLAEEGTDAFRIKTAASASYGSIGLAMRLASDEDYWNKRKKVFCDFFGNTDRSDIIRISSEWKEMKSDSDQLLNILEGFVRNLLQYRLGKKADTSIDEYADAWKRFSEQADLDRFSLLSDRISQARRQISFNVSFQAVIEQLLLVFIGERESYG